MTIASRNNITGPQGNLNGVAAAISDLAVEYGQANDATTQTINSTSYADLTSMTTTKTTETGDIVFLMFTCSHKQSAAGDEFTYNLLRDGVSIHTKSVCSGSSSGTSYGECFAMQYIDAPSAGAHTYKVQCKRITGAGSADVRERALTGLILQTDS